MDKKNRAAFENFPDGNQKADFAGENPAGYLAPEVSVCAFAPEKGFANTVLRKNESVYVDVDEAATAKEANIDKWQESADSKYF